MGEFDLIDEIRRRFAPQIGDDAAVNAPGGATATSVDAFIDGVHFRRQTAPLRSIGRKAAAASLSDLAAMAARPGEVYVVLGVPPDLDEAGCLEVGAGIAEVAAESGAVLAGGDVTRAPVLTLAITVVGHAREPEDFVRRNGAGAGDALVVSGELGGAAAGLALLESPGLADSLAPGIAEGLRARQLDPRPRLALGLALAKAGARAMIDVSDGLAADAAHLARESGVALEIDVADVPVAEGVTDVAAAGGLDASRLSLAGGEDYELLAALPCRAVAGALAAAASLGERLTEIGRVTEGAGLRLLGPKGEVPVPAGFDHLAG